MTIVYTNCMQKGLWRKSGKGGLFNSVGFVSHDQQILEYQILRVRCVKRFGFILDATDPKKLNKCF